MRFRGVPRGTPSHRSLNENRPSLIVYVRRFPAAERGEEGEKEGADRHASKSVVILLPPGRTGSGSSRFYLNRKSEKKKKEDRVSIRESCLCYFFRVRIVSWMGISGSTKPSEEK